MKHLILFFFSFCLFLPQLRSQRISSLTASAAETSVQIRYTLSDTAADRWYRVSLQGIVDNDTVALAALSGDIGDSIQVGQHLITWDALAEYGRFRGSISFYLEVVPQFEMLPGETPASVKRGNPLPVVWYGGNSQEDQMTLVLYRYDDPVDTLTTVTQTDRYTWRVPNDLSPGSGYRIRVQGTDLTDIDDYTGSFTVKRRLPLWAIIAPAAAVVGTVTVLLLTSRQPLPPPPGVDTIR
jgi:hypothetical protein